MTRIVLINAGPTAWDLEDRVVGSSDLPLDEQAIRIVGQTLETIPPPVTSIYRDKDHEACEQVAQMLAWRFQAKPRHNGQLKPVHLGLWEGLTREELRHRFPRVYGQWMERPLAVNLPGAEPLENAIERLSEAMLRILRRNMGITTAIVLRPLAMQIVAGVLRRESPETLAGHLHEVQAVETIGMTDGDVIEFVR